MRVSIAIATIRQLNHSSKHIQERNEVENDRSVDQELVCLDDRGAVNLTDQQNQARYHCLDKNRDIRRLPLRMDLAECRRQIAVDTDNKRDSRDSSNGAAHSAGIPERDKHGCQNAK